jgi:hypothetical protein
MTMDPGGAESWNGLFDVMRPPPGYRLHAAFGTTYGLGLEALVASLIAMGGHDAEQLVSDPIAGLLATTQFAPHVRIFFHAGKGQPPHRTFPPQLVALLEQVVVPVSLPSGDFHPKLWVLRFTELGGNSKSGDRIRVLIGSRNLAISQSLEAGILLEGEVGGHQSSFGATVAEAVETCLPHVASRSDAVSNLPSVLRRTKFDAPHEGEDVLQMRWQSSRKVPLSAHIPKEVQRAIVVAPFLSPAFIDRVLPRFKEATVVSSVDAFNKLDDSTFDRLERASAHVTLYTVGEYSGGTEDDDAGRLDGAHAKLLIVDNGKRSSGMTFIGSSNATGQGWGLGGPTNVEAMVQASPGLGYDRFLESFVRTAKGQPRVWITEFTREQRVPISEIALLRDQLRTALGDLAATRLIIGYDAAREMLSVKCNPSDTSRLARVLPGGARAEFVPFGLLAERPQWTPVHQLIDEPVSFASVPFASVTAFMVMRAVLADTGVQCLACGRLELSREALRKRDEVARDRLMASTPSADILAALILSNHSHSRSRLGSGDDPKTRHSSNAPILSKVSLEQVLLAVARNPGLVRDMRLLLSGHADPAFVQFCSDLEATAPRVTAT